MRDESAMTTAMSAPTMPKGYVRSRRGLQSVTEMTKTSNQPEEQDRPTNESAAPAGASGGDPYKQRKERPAPGPGVQDVEAQNVEVEEEE